MKVTDRVIGDQLGSGTLAGEARKAEGGPARRVRMMKVDQFANPKNPSIIVRGYWRLASTFRM